MAPQPEPLAHTRHVLARCLGDAVTVTDFRCRACRHTPGEEECNTDPSIVFVRRGLFVRGQEGETVFADSRQVLFFNPRQPYRISHPIEGGDDCTILTIAQPLAAEIVTRHAPHCFERPGWHPFARGKVDAGLESWRLHYQLLAAVRADTPLTAEELLLAFIDRIVGESQYEDRRVRRTTSRRVKERTIRRHTELAHAAATAINRALASPPGLHDLAAALACSPYHLSHIFREVTGSSLRSYLSTARARAAADAIERGARNLTELALVLGYVDHSHFTNAFTREWQVSPSVFRTLVQAERRRRH